MNKNQDNLQRQVKTWKIRRCSIIAFTATLNLRQWSSNAADQLKCLKQHALMTQSVG